MIRYVFYGDIFVPCFHIKNNPILIIVMRIHHTGVKIVIGKVKFIKFKHRVFWSSPNDPIREFMPGFELFVYIFMMISALAIELSCIRPILQTTVLVPIWKV